MTKKLGKNVCFITVKKLPHKSGEGKLPVKNRKWNISSLSIPIQDNIKIQNAIQIQNK